MEGEAKKVTRGGISGLLGALEIMMVSGSRRVGGGGEESHSVVRTIMPDSAEVPVPRFRYSGKLMCAKSSFLLFVCFWGNGGGKGVNRLSRMRFIRGEADFIGVRFLLRVCNDRM